MTRRTDGGAGILAQAGSIPAIPTWTIIGQHWQCGKTHDARDRPEMDERRAGRSYPGKPISNSGAKQSYGARCMDNSNKEQASIFDNTPCPPKLGATRIRRAGLTRAFSSAGQSSRLITDRSRVRIPEGPPPGRCQDPPHGLCRGPTGESTPRAISPTRLRPFPLGPGARLPSISPSSLKSSD